MGVRVRGGRVAVGRGGVLLLESVLREEFPRVRVQHRRPVAGTRRESRPLVPAIRTDSDLGSIVSDGIAKLPLSPPEKTSVVEHVLGERV